MLPPTTSLSISNFPPSSSRLSSPLVTSLMTSFHHSVCFGDLAIPTGVSVVMMTLTTFLAGVMRQAMGMLDSQGEDLSLKLLILFWTSLMISILGCQRLPMLRSRWSEDKYYRLQLWFWWRLGTHFHCVPKWRFHRKNALATPLHRAPRLIWIKYFTQRTVCHTIRAFKSTVL